MRVVILADRTMAVRERDMLARLEIGLADEGVRVCHAVPRACLIADAETSAGGGGEGGTTGQAGIYSTVVAFEDTGWAFTRPARVHLLADDLMRALEGDDVRCVDLIHCFAAPPSRGGVLGLGYRGLWPLAVELARRTHARLLLEVSGAGHIGPGASLVSHKVAVVAGSGAGPGAARPPEFAAPGDSIRRAILKRAPRARVHVVPWGVHAPAGTRAPRPNGDRMGRPLGVVFLAGSSRNLHVAAAVQSLVRLLSPPGPEAAAGAAPPPDALVFAGSAPGLDHGLAVLARRYGLTGRLCLVPDPETHREPVLESDLLIIADDAGQHRSLILEAMARGMVVVAAADPLADDLVDGVTARLVKRPTPEAWSEALGPLLRSAADRATLGASAQGHIRQRRSVSGQVRSIFAAYEAMLRDVGAPSD